jgi:hypothetical protein
MPKAMVIAVLLNPNNPQAANQVPEIKAAALELGLQINFSNASTAPEIDNAYSAIVQHRVAIRPRQAANKTKLDRVIGDVEDNRDRRSRRLRRDGGGDATDRGNHRDLMADQLGSHRRKSSILALSPAIFDGDVLSLDIAGRFEAVAKCCGKSGVWCRRWRSKQSDHWHSRLLRARR